MSTTDQYAPCPCGSGKKFKWCCQAIAPMVDKARTQQENGQYEAALHTVEELVKQHPGNPQAWGHLADIRFANGQLEAAEQAIDKAFEISPHYPFGYLLRGMMRESENELLGALLLYRKATQHYDLNAKTIQANLHERIARLELLFKRTVAARAALERAAFFAPNFPEIRERIDEYFGDKPPHRFPKAARKSYTFRPARAEQLEAWKKAIPDLPNARLSDARAAFARLTQEHPHDAEAWFNLALCEAWLGNNPAALDALEQYIDLETDQDRVNEAVGLSQALQFGRGAEERSDYRDYRAIMMVRDFAAVRAWVNDWAKAGRLAAPQADPQTGTLHAMIVEDAPGLLVTALPMMQLSAHLLIAGDVILLSHPNEASLQKTAQAIRDRVGIGVSEPQYEVGTLQFGDIFAEAILFPKNGTFTREQADAALREQIAKFFENTWIHRPLKSLDGVTPIDAVQHPKYRKRLVGVLAFLEDVISMYGYDPESEVQPPKLYDLDRLRRQLGLTVSGSSPATESANGLDLSVLSVAELAGLAHETLTEAQLEEGFRAALKLDARELAGSFARSLVARPIHEAKPDRFPYYNHLVELAREANDTEAVLAWLEAGARADAEANAGKRRNDFALRIGQHYARQGDTAKAASIFADLLDRSPYELRFYATAAETMLSCKDGAKALEFAERGLAKARSQNNRDSEMHFLELTAAAKKQLG